MAETGAHSVRFVQKGRIRRPGEVCFAQKVPKHPKALAAILLTEQLQTCTSPGE